MPTTERASLKDLLARHSACEEAVQWAEQFATPAEAWEKCHRPDWMLWSLDELGIEDEAKLRLFACWCARNTPLGDGRTTWDLLTDERSRRAVDVAERFARGEELATAMYAAMNAARDAALAAAGENTAENATWAATWAAAAKAQADALRTIVGNPFLEGA